MFKFFSNKFSAISLFETKLDCRSTFSISFILWLNLILAVHLLFNWFTIVSKYCKKNIRVFVDTNKVGNEIFQYISLVVTRNGEVIFCKKPKIVSIYCISFVY